MTSLDEAGLLDQHRWAATDMNFFDAWATSIAGGDLWTERAQHPHHAWHAESAAIHFITRPEERAALTAEAERRADGSTAATLLWDRWYGGTVFHQEPLYPYLVAATYTFAGAEVRAVFAWQVMLGLASLGLLWSITARLFGRPSALVAVVLGGGYQTLLVYESALLRATSMVFFALLVVRVTMWAWRRQTLWRGAVLGACCGAAVLMKSTFALIPLGVVLALFVSARRAGRSWRSVVPAAVGGLVGALLIVSPAFVRNVRVGAPMTSLSSVGGVAMLATNSAGEEPSLMGWYHDPWLIARVMGETNGEAGAVTQATLLTHDKPWDVLGYVAQRFAHVAHAFESPNNISVDAYVGHAPSLRWAVFRWDFVLPWALLGALLVGRHPARRRRAAALLGACAAAIVPLVAFVSLARYRLVFAALAIPFAAYALVTTVAWLRTQRWRFALPTLAAAAVLIAYVGRPLPPGVRAVRVADITAPHDYSLRPRVDQALERGDAIGAHSLLAAAVADEPLEIARLGRGVEIQWGRTAELAEHYASLWRDVAELASALKRVDDARYAAARAELLASAAERYDDRS